MSTLRKGSTIESKAKLYGAVTKLQSLVEKYPTGAKLPSDRTMAKELQISNVTVSMAMQELERLGWIERRSRSGSYRVDINLHRHVAVYCEMDVFHRDASRYYGRLIQKLREELAKAGLRSVPYIGMTAPYEQAAACTASGFLQDLTEGRIRAVINVASQGYAWWKGIRDDKLPIIGVNPYFHCAACSRQRDIIIPGIQMLFAQGRRRIGALMWGGEDIRGERSSVEDSRGIFIQAMKDFQLEINPQWIRSEIHPSVKNAGWEEIRSIWQASATEKPDGLLILDDVLFRDAMLAFPELGIKPGENIDIVAQINRGLEPPGSHSVIQAVVDAQEIASTLIELLREWLDQGRPADPRRITVKPSWRFPTYDS